MKRFLFAILLFAGCHKPADSIKLEVADTLVAQPIAVDPLRVETETLRVEPLKVESLTVEPITVRVEIVHTGCGKDCGCQAKATVEKPPIRADPPKLPHCPMPTVKPTRK